MYQYTNTCIHMIACSLAMHAVWIFRFPQKETRHDLFVNYSYQERFENLLLQNWWLLKELFFVLFRTEGVRAVQPPNPYRVRPCLLRAQTTSMAVTVFLLACSVQVTASRMTFSRKTSKQDRKKKIVLHNYLENTPGLLVDEATDPLDTTPPCKSPDSRLGDALLIDQLQLENMFKKVLITWMLSLNTLRCLLAPPLPNPFPPLPLPVMVELFSYQWLRTDG